MLLSNLLIPTIITINNLTNFLNQIVPSAKIKTIILIYANNMEEEAELILYQDFNKDDQQCWLLVNIDTYNSSFVFTKYIYRYFYIYESYFIITLLKNLNNINEFLLYLYFNYHINSAIIHRASPNILFVKNPPNETVLDLQILYMKYYTLNMVLLYWTDRKMLFTHNIPYTNIRFLINDDNESINYDQLFFDKYSLVNKDHIIGYILALNPPRAVLLTNDKQSTYIVSLGGVNAYIGRLLNSFSNVTVEFITFINSMYLPDKSKEFKNYYKTFVEKQFVDNVSPIKVHAVNNSK